MFRNYLIIALRNIVRHKLYSFINIAGLTMGLTCAIFIILKGRGTGWNVPAANHPGIETCAGQPAINASLPGRRRARTVAVLIRPTPHR